MDPEDEKFLELKQEDIIEAETPEPEQMFFKNFDDHLDEDDLRS